MPHTWHSFLYFFGVGGFLFVLPIVLAVRKNALDLKKPSDRKLLFSLVGVFLCYLIVLAVWNWGAQGPNY